MPLADKNSNYEINKLVYSSLLNTMNPNGSIMGEGMIGIHHSDSNTNIPPKVVEIKSEEKKNDTDSHLNDHNDRNVNSTVDIENLSAAQKDVTFLDVDADDEE